MRVEAGPGGQAAGAPGVEGLLGHVAGVEVVLRAEHEAVLARGLELAVDDAAGRAPVDVDLADRREGLDQLHARGDGVRGEQAGEAGALAHLRSARAEQLVDRELATEPSRP